MKNFIKNNISAVVVVLAIFFGGSALAVYTELTPTGGGSDLPFTVITDDKGNIKDIKKGDIETTDPTVKITQDQFNTIEEKGRNNFKNENGSIVEKTNPRPKYKYIATYNDDGTLTQVMEKPTDLTTITGKYIELADREYQDIQQKGLTEYQVIDGKLSLISKEPEKQVEQKKDLQGNVLPIIGN